MPFQEYAPSHLRKHHPSICSFKQDAFTSQDLYYERFVCPEALGRLMLNVERPQARFANKYALIAHRLSPGSFQRALLSHNIPLKHVLSKSIFSLKIRTIPPIRFRAGFHRISTDGATVAFAFADLFGKCAWSLLLWYFRRTVRTSVPAHFWDVQGQPQVRITPLLGFQGFGRLLCVMQLEGTSAGTFGHRFGRWRLFGGSEVSSWDLNFCHLNEFVLFCGAYPNRV